MMERTLGGLGLLTAMLLLAACQRAPAPLPVPGNNAVSPATPMPPSAPLAPVQIERLDLDNTVDADGRVVQPRVHFAPHDTVYAVLILTCRETGVHTVDASWSYLDTRQTFLAERKTLTAPGHFVMGFQIHKPDGWPLGQYRLEIRVDGQLQQTRLFDVTP